MKSRIPIAAVAFFVVPSVLHAESINIGSLDLTHAKQGWGKPQADKSVGGHTLTLKGKTFSHGFGTHAFGLLVVDLNGGSTRFKATVGVDDEVPSGQGSVEFLVLGDYHKILWRSGVLRQGDQPKDVDLDLTGIKQISLRVTTGGDDFRNDHADWAGAVFEVTGEAPKVVTLVSPDPVISMASQSPAPHIGEPVVTAIRPGTPFLWTPPVSGNRPIAFSANGLPRGLKIDGVTGTITGRLAKSGDYSVGLRVKNASGSDSRTIHILVGNILVATPPMGWNSYDCFGDNVTEDEVLSNARYIADKMQPSGWDTVVVDYRWYDPGAHDNNANARAGADLTMDSFGRLLPSENRFPSAAGGAGFKALADKVHAMGLRFGIHIMRGIPRNAVTKNLPIEGSAFHAVDAANTSDKCPWCPDMYGVRGDTPAGKAYYDSLFKLYAAWGVDYVKMDDTSRPYHTNEIEAVHSAIEKCGRSIVYSLSPGNTPIDQAAHVSSHANLWRVSDDFWDSWTALDNEFTLGDLWKGVPGPGHWPDADMLPLGHLSIHNRSVGADRMTAFTKAEQMTLMSLWALLPSPLMVGGSLPDNDPWTLALLTNPEVIAVNQDGAGSSAKRLSHSDLMEIWSRQLSDGSIVVGMFNTGDFDSDILFDAASLGFKGNYAVRDLWMRKPLGNLHGLYLKHIVTHGAVLLRLVAARK